jgi:hypothetical protein
MHEDIALFELFSSHTGNRKASTFGLTVLF